MSNWVNYEITTSIQSGMGLLGVYIHHLNDPIRPRYQGIFDPQNPLDNHFIQEDSFFGKVSTQASEKYSTYRWSTNTTGLFGASNNLGDWIEDAARKAGR